MGGVRGADTPQTGGGEPLDPWLALIDRTNDLFCTASADGYLLDLNAAWTRVLGWTHEELRSRPYIEFVHPDDVAPTLAQAEAVRDPDGWFPSFENRYRTRDGDYRSLLWSACTDGSRFYALAKDITERRAAEERADRAHVRLAEAQAVARIGSWEWEPDTGRLEWSEELYRLYGEHPASFAPSYEAFMERVHPEDRAALAAQIEKTLSSGEPYEFEHRVVLGTGAVRTMQARGRVVRREDGTIARLTGTGQDVTEQLATAAALRETAARLAAQEELRRRAVELNDDVVQELVVAILELESGSREDVERRLTGALDRIRTIVSELLPDVEELRPGDLRRREEPD